MMRTLGRQVAALSHLISMVRDLPPLIEGGGGRKRRGGIAALPSGAAEPEVEDAGPTWNFDENEEHDDTVVDFDV